MCVNIGVFDMQTVLCDIDISFYCYPVVFLFGFRNLTDIEQKTKHFSWWKHDIGIFNISNVSMFYVVSASELLIWAIAELDSRDGVTTLKNSQSILFQRF